MRPPATSRRTSLQRAQDRPRLAALVAATALLAVLLAAGSSAQAAWASETTLTPPRQTILYGREAALVATGLPPAADATLTGAVPEGAFSVVTTLQADASGTARAVVSPKRATAYRLEWMTPSADPSAPVPATSTVAYVRVRPQLALWGSTMRAFHGGWTATTPKMVPPGGARTLIVQRYVGGGHWRTVERVFPARRWTFPADAVGTQAWRFRWVGDAQLAFNEVAFRPTVRRRAGRADVLRRPLAAASRSARVGAPRYRRAWADAKEGEERLAAIIRSGRGTVAGQAAFSLRQASGYARAGRLTWERAGVLSHQLAINGRYFATHGIPGGGKVKLTVPGSALVWAYFPGHGVQFHPVDSLHRARMHLRHRDYARAAALADELLDMQVTRRGAGRGFQVSEYGFAYEGHAPPWVSGMAEGLKIEVLGALARRSTDKAAQRRYLDAAHRALPVFDVSWTSGGVLDLDGHSGRWYLEYAYWDRQRVLNGFQFALLGLSHFARDAERSPSVSDATRADAAKARRLFELGVLEMVRHLSAYDLGSWSRYSEGGERASTVYHQIHVMFLEQIASLTTNAGAASTCRRYARKWGGSRSAPMRAPAPRGGTAGQDRGQDYMEEEWLLRMPETERRGP